MDLNTLKFLVVDDDDGDRKMLRRILAKAGHVGDVAEATTAKDAMEKADVDFDVIFLDYYMPGTTGLTHLPEFHRRWPRAAIFLMTGQGNEDVAKSAILQGATDYIAKGPMSTETLTTMLATGVAAARQKWKVEQQTLDLATFSEVLVHDFKAPIRAASFLAEQIAEDLDAGELEGVQDGLRLLKKSADQMNAMIRSLSDHIRLDRETEFSEYSPSALIDATKTALSLVIEESGAELSIDVSPDVPEISCSGPQIAQLLQNLVSNAIKYSGDAPPRIGIRVTPQGDGGLFEVSDNGIGIPPEHRETVFEPFKRAPGAGGVAGTGLGLATCRKIVLRHGGRIWCESRPGEGTSFSFSLPFHPDGALSQPSPIHA